MPGIRKEPGSRKIQKRLLILCEGAKDKSESAYFKSLIKSCRLSGNRVDVRVIDSKKNSGKELVMEAQKNREFIHDEVWVVYDKDGYTCHAETFEIARQSKVNIGFSSISFEFWILLHYEYTTRAFSKSEEIINYLKSKNYIDYSKGSGEVFSKTKSLLPVARKNAEKLQKYLKEGHGSKIRIYDLNPYCNLNKLIERIEALEKE